MYLSKIFLLAIITGGLSLGDIIDTVTINTSPLIGHSAGPFALELQFNDGNGTGDANNTAVLSTLMFGGGSVSGTPSVFGGVTGDLGSSITMTDSSFFNQFIQGFSPGISLSFQLALTTNLDSGGAPDEFSLSILDSSGVEIPTLGPANAFLIIDINSATPSTSAFASDTGQSPNAAGPPIDIGAPQIGSVSSVPEPNTFVLLSAAVCLIALSGRRGCLKDPKSIANRRRRKWPC
jgi:hypothetical protein